MNVESKEQTVLLNILTTFVLHVVVPCEWDNNVFGLAVHRYCAAN